MTALTLRGLTKEFGDVPAVHGIDLDIPSGQLLALLGPSGSGKTTLLRIIAGLELPNAGQVLFDAEDALTMRVQDRRVGFVFQHYALFRHLTVADNIAFGLRSKPRRVRPNTAEIQRRVATLLDLVQLPDLAGRYPAQLSGGQRQRVALARALAIEPKVLLLDEPFGALDAQVRRDLRGWLRRLHDQTGHTTVFVTHDQDEALELADRVVVMNRGAIQQDGTPDDVYDHPANPFVHEFIGESSRLAVTVTDGGQIMLNDHVLGQTAACTGPALLFVRPHALLLASEGQGVPATVVGQRRHGAVRRLQVNLLGLPQAMVELDAPPTLSLRAGMTVQVWLSHVACFPREVEG